MELREDLKRKLEKIKPKIEERVKENEMDRKKKLHGLSQSQLSGEQALIKQMQIMEGYNQTYHEVRKLYCTGLPLEDVPLFYFQLELLIAKTRRDLGNM